MEEEAADEGDLLGFEPVDEGKDDELVALASWAGDETYSIRPKDFFAAFIAKSCVFRPALHSYWKSLQQYAKEFAIPGLYLAGPPGVGKSTMLYMLALVARRAGWLVVYTPECDEWQKGTEAGNTFVAMGKFLDAVAQAVAGMSEDVQKDFSLLKLDDAKSWKQLAFDEDNHKRVKKVYLITADALKTYTRYPVLLVFDEVNMLFDKWGDKVEAFPPPFDLVAFQKTLAYGCLLVSGTPDAPYLQSIGAGLKRYVEYAQPLENGELAAWRKSQQYAPVLTVVRLGAGEADQEDVEQDAWERIVHLTGGVPRELVELRVVAEKMAQPDRKRRRSSDGGEEEKDAAMADAQQPAPVALDMLLERYVRERADDWHGRIRSKAGPGKDCEAGLLSVLDTLFTRPDDRPDEDFDAMRVGALFKDARMSFSLRPTTPITSECLYTLWMAAVREGKRPSWEQAKVHALATLMSQDDAGGERGYALEKLVLHELPFKRRTELFFHDVTGKQEGSFVCNVHEQRLMHKDFPPAHWKLLRPHTLVTHKKGGEQRVDLILYETDTVYFLELTVGDYRKSKVVDPAWVCAIVRKWVGQLHFDVQVQGDKLVASHCRQQTRTTPPVPKLEYLVVTTHPVLNVDARTAQANAYMRIVCLDDLRKSGIVPEEAVERIVKVQSATSKKAK